MNTDFVTDTIDNLISDLQTLSIWSPAEREECEHMFKDDKNVVLVSSSGVWLSKLDDDNDYGYAVHSVVRHKLTMPLMCVDEADGLREFVHTVVRNLIRERS